MNSIDKQPNYQDIAIVLGSTGLEKRTNELRGFCQKVGNILDSGLMDEVRQEIATNVTDIVPVSGQTEPVGRLYSLFTGVSSIVENASGHGVDTVINPCSGSDISAGVSYGCKTLVTLDEGDLFAVHDNDDTSLADRLKRYVFGKLINGMHAFNNQGLVSYAAELYLLGVDLDSLQVLAQVNVDKVALTKIQFRIGEKTITHINLGRVNLGKDFSNSQGDQFVRNELVHIMDTSEKALMLSKATHNVDTGSILDLLPKHSLVVSDRDEKQYFKNSAQVRSLKTQIIIDELLVLQNGPPPEHLTNDGRSNPRLYYGYVTDLRDLEILEII